MPSKVSQILWGPTLDNVLNFGYPLGHLVTDRVPRDGSEWAHGVSGVEDAWITGYDYTMDVEARFLPLQPNAYGAQAPNPLQSPISGGGLGLQDFLDFARQKQTFRFVPDIAVPQVFIDGCYLAQPTKGGRSLTARLDYSQKLTIRNPTTPFLQAFRGLFYEYEAGQSIVDPLVHTYTRASITNQISRDGLLQQLASGVLADGHYLSGLHTTLLQAAATNKLTAPEDLSNAAWIKPGTTTPTINNTSPRGDATATFVREDTSGAGHAIYQLWTASAAGNTAGWAGFLKYNGRGKARLDMQGAGSGNRFAVTVDLLAGTAVTATAGTATLTFFQMVPLVNGWFFVQMYGAIGDGTTSRAFQVNLLDNTGALSYTGDGASGLYVWGAVATDNGLAGMYWGTGASRVADSLSLTWPYKPQGVWAYLKFIELGASYAPGGQFPSTFYIGDAASSWRQLIYGPGAAGGWSIVQNANGGSQNDTSIAGGNRPLIGEVVELLGLFKADTSVELHQVRNAGTELVATGGTVSPGFPSGYGAGPVLDLSPQGAFATAGSAVVKVGPGALVNTIAKARAA